jgi:hypothetical protein
MGEVFAVQDEIASSIIGKLKVHLESFGAIPGIEIVGLSKIPYARRVQRNRR